jgi:hypothetical protein
MIVERFGQEITGQQRATMLLPLIAEIERQQNLEYAIDGMINLKYQAILVLGHDVSGQSFRSVLQELYVVRDNIAQQTATGPTPGAYKLVPGREAYLPAIQESGKAAMPQLRPVSAFAVLNQPPIQAARGPYGATTIRTGTIPGWFWLALGVALVIFVIRR